jgi:carbon-monoxide dehydrogenase medium subunit
VIPAPFEYARAATVDDALALLAEHGDEAKLVAGGHSLLPLMKLRLATPAVLIDITRIGDLSYVREDGDEIAVGALTRHCEVERSAVLQEHCGLLSHVAGFVGDPQVRHRGTLGGSLAHSDPASDLPAAVLALDAALVVRGPNGDRTIAAADFFTGFLESALAPDELLVEVRVPKLPGARWSYQKFVKRAQDWAIVGAAAVHGPTHTGVALVNMGSTPVRAAAVERALAGGATAREAAQSADEGTSPSADFNASEDYRRHLARVLTGRALTEAGA